MLSIEDVKWAAQPCEIDKKHVPREVDLLVKVNQICNLFGGQNTMSRWIHT